MLIRPPKWRQGSLKAPCSRWSRYIFTACSAGGELPFDQKTLAIFIARIKKDVVLCQNMLCTIAKAAGR